MKIGIIGSGEVAKTLAQGFFKSGWDVVIGSHHPEKLKEFSLQNPQIKVDSFSAAAAFGEMVVLSVKGLVAEQTVLDLRANLQGKIVIDTTNPISEEPPQNGVLNYFTDFRQSLMEKIQAVAPEAYLVKAFNSVGSAFMIHPNFQGQKPTMFICGNDQNAKEKVKNILEGFSWEVEDVGSAESARALEPLCILWCLPGFLHNEWSHAFKLLKK